MSNVLVCIVMVFAVWYEWELVKTALEPLGSAIICILFAVLCLGLTLLELSLIVIAPVALYVGKESRHWHLSVLRIPLEHLSGKKMKP